MKSFGSRGLIVRRLAHLLVAVGFALTVALSACSGRVTIVEPTPTLSPTVQVVEVHRRRVPIVWPTPTPTPTVHVEVHRHRVTDCMQRRHDWQEVGQVHWSADGTTLYWQSLSDVFAISVDGSGLHQVVDSKLTGDVAPPSALRLLYAATTSVSLSPDGTHVVYSSCEFPDPDAVAYEGYGHEAADYQYEIVRGPIAGGAPERLTTDGAYDNFPSWSPDGSRIAFLSSRFYGGAVHLVTMAPDGSDLRDLTPEFAAVIQHPPQWAPDGQRLAFVAYSRRGDGGVSSLPGLYTVRAAGTELRRLAPAVRSPVAWSPDGQRLAFAQAVDDTVMLVTVAADGSDQQQLVPIEGWQPQSGDPDPNHAWINTVAWSPDGTRLLVSVNDRHPAFIVELDRPYRREVGILRNPAGRFHGVRAAAWSPDGAQLALLGPSLLAIVPADGGPIRGLAESVGIAVNTEGQPTRDLVVLSGSDLDWQPLNASVLDTPVDATACAAGVAVADPAANPGLVADCAALLEVQQALAGGGALNWSVDRPMPAWDGLTLAGAPLRVQALALGERPLTPTPALGALRRPLPAALGKLTHLQALKLRGHRFTGPIPPELGQLTALRELDLSGNQLTEAIPPALGQLANLETLDLAKNDLTGPIPPELGQPTSLRDLDLSENRLTGPIPPELAPLANLETLDLSDNQLTGPIQLAPGQWPGLRELELQNNELSGPIPIELTQVTSLEFLNLGGNDLTGPIPPALGDLTSLVVLALGGNQLTGAIPPELGALTNLGVLSLPLNPLTGTIPAELGQLGNLSDLDLFNCQLTGPIPSELGQIESLFSIRLGGNRLTGCVPPALLANVPAYNSDLHDLNLPVCESAE
ncbi:MAG: leucine-rich repeat domain-containing protein [Chloroflexi bacterium]|nr:leucine-rich repeat domain-containing protein [Chloroflexota bacterium]